MDVDDRNLVEPLAWFSARSLTRLPRSFRKIRKGGKVARMPKKNIMARGVVPGIGIFAALFQFLQHTF